MGDQFTLSCTTVGGGRIRRALHSGLPEVCVLGHRCAPSAFSRAGQFRAYSWKSEALGSLLRELNWSTPPYSVCSVATFEERCSHRDFI